MLDSSIIEILRCPITKTGLSVADSSLIQKLNASIEAGELSNRVGQTITDSIDSGLVNEDQSVLLPVRNEIAILVADQAIDL